MFCQTLGKKGFHNGRCSCFRTLWGFWLWGLRSFWPRINTRPGPARIARAAVGLMTRAVARDTAGPQVCSVRPGTCSGELTSCGSMRWALVTEQGLRILLVENWVTEPTLPRETLGSLAWCARCIPCESAREDIYYVKHYAVSHYFILLDRRWMSDSRVCVRYPAGGFEPFE